MTASTPRPIMRLGCPFNGDAPELYCPRTGEFVYLRDDLRERLEATRARLVAAGADPDDLVDIEVLLEHPTRRGADGLRTAHQRHGLRPRQPPAVVGV